MADSPEGMFKAMDADLLQGHCVATCIAERAAARVFQEGDIVADKDGNKVENPSVKMFSRMFALTIRSASALGLTPVSRTRIRA
ncbi:P27 family phage terminase small subunit, partial [Candidatus Magnetaquicoccus inordinatus]|uniref:P27 family phage terminase small subunit n=1 Tax=Candidatus Magnetaquicoccus inordinatus TaxID=2496818 RepID=UPI00102CD95F